MLVQLYKGFEIKLSSSERIIVHGIVIRGIGDLQGESAFLNFMHHNAKYDYLHCTIESKCIDHEAIYEYKENLNLRTSKYTIETAERC